MYTPPDKIYKNYAIIIFLIAGFVLGSGLTYNYAETMTTKQCNEFISDNYVDNDNVNNINYPEKKEVIFLDNNDILQEKKMFNTSKS